MSAADDRFMWLMVFFDLPVGTKPERHAATKFRNFLIKDGFIMLQWSVYARICNGQERINKHLKRVEASLPVTGSIRALQVTDQQYGRMRIMLGKAKFSEEKAADQLLLF